MRRPKCYLKMNMFESLVAEFADWCMDTGYNLNKYGESIFPTEEVRIRKSKPKYTRINWVGFLGSDLDYYVKRELRQNRDPDNLIREILSTAREYRENNNYSDQELTKKIRGTIRNAKIDLRKEGWDG